MVSKCTALLLSGTLLIGMMGGILPAQGQTVLQGIMKGQEGQGERTIYVSYVDNKGYQNDRIQARDGKFEWRKTADFPMSVTLSLQPPGPHDIDYVSFWTEPGTLQLELDPDNLSAYRLTGSALNDLSLRFGATFRSESEQIAKITRELRTAQSNQDEAAIAVLRKQYQQVNAELTKKYLKFLEEHPDSYLSASLLFASQQSLSSEEQEHYLGLLRGPALESPYARRIRYDLDGERAGQIGAKAKMFTGTDINGNAFDLADLIGEKYVLIDFWASWCVPCRKGNPHLKALHDKYRDHGLEVVLVADNDSSPDEWRKAVAQDQIEQFTHILRGWRGIEYFFDRRDISGMYGVRSLPTKVLIDKNGIIIGRYGGGGESDEAMDLKLKELFGT